MGLADSTGALVQGAKRLADAGRTDEAITAVEEAVGIRRHLVEVHGTFMYERDVAHGLAELADLYARAGRSADAIAAGDEGVAILHTLSASHAFLKPDWLNALSRNGSMKAAVGEWQSAAADLGAAVRGFYAMAARDSYRFEPGLGVSMGRLRDLLGTVSFQPDDLELLAEASAGTSGTSITSDSPAPDPFAASVARELALLRGDRAGALAAMETFKQLAEEFPGIFTPDVERCEPESGGRTGPGPESEAARPFGCETCWGEDPVAVKDNILRTCASYSTLVSGSHFAVSLIRCRTCKQLFASIFTEYVDWNGGEDPQYSVLVPLTRPEADSLIAGQMTVHAIGPLAAGRRHLHSDWPAGATKKVYWSERAFTVDEGE